MRFDLSPDGIIPIGGDRAFFDDVPSDNDKTKQNKTEQAFVDAGLCDEEYLALTSLKGMGAVKERRHQERRSRENQSRTIRRSFNGVGMPSRDVLNAVRSARST